MAEDFSTADEPDLGPDDHPRLRLHHLAMRFKEIGSSFRRIANEWEIEMDFTSFDAAVAQLKTDAANIETTQAAAVAAGVAAAQAADQAELEAKVSSDLTPANIGFPEPRTPAPEPEVAPEADPTAEQPAS